MATMLLIMQGAQIVAVLTPIALAAVVAIRKMFENNTNGFSIQIVQLQDGAIRAVSETEAMIDAWRKANPNV